jgi:D-amino peptidase
MKVLIAVDIEGGSGIANAREYEHFDYGRRWITEDTNAAVEGALEGGAREITVADTHGRHNDNILFDLLHPQARLVRGGKNTPLYFLEGLTAETDLVMLIGWHDKLGGPGVLAHTFVHQEIRAMYLNGKEVGEVELAAILAGDFGVPIGLVTGDNVTCENAISLFGEVETACVKRTLDRYAADCLPLAQARQLIKDRARQAVERAVEFRPYKVEPPYILTWACADHNIARILARLPGSELSERNSVSFFHEQFRVIFDVLVLWRTLLRTATIPN